MFAIRVENLSKTFNLPHEARSTLKDYFLHPFHRTTYEKFEALKDVSFEVKKGEWVGVIGRNGSGKSTLLKILAGVYVPDAGKIEINGKVIPLLELGVGFNPELSGRENIFLNGTMLGMRKKEIEEKFDAIVDFAEIRKFLDLPLKNYSSGMQVRLAFAIASQVDAEIYLLDEVLAVGDLNFQQKCFETFKKFKELGKTVLYVSHDMNAIMRFCERTLLLESGKIVSDAQTSNTLSKYLETSVNITQDNLQIKSYKIGNNKIKIENFKILDQNNNEKSEILSGEPIYFTFSIVPSEKILDNVFLGFSIYPKNSEMHIFSIEKKLDSVLSEMKVSITIPRLAITAGNYFLSVGLTDESTKWTYPYDLHEKQYLLKVITNEEPPAKNFSSVRLPFDIKIYE